jgi:hypothetical protein
MTQNFTPNHLVQYLYKETTASQTLAISEALYEDAALCREFESLCQGYQQLPRATFRPSSATIQSILGYSRSTALEKHA